MIKLITYNITQLMVHVLLLRQFWESRVIFPSVILFVRSVIRRACEQDNARTMSTKHRHR